MFLLCFDFEILVISRFGFEGWLWVLITSVPGLCILLTFIGSLMIRLSFFLISSITSLMELRFDIQNVIIFQALLPSKRIDCEHPPMDLCRFIGL